MEKTIIAAFTSADSADAAVADLEKMGYTTQDISVISRDNKEHAAKTVGENTAEGAASGATTGAVVGGIAGLLAGAGVIPALAGLLIGGPIAVALGATGVVATTISGVVTGGVAGGLIGALVGLGVSDEDAHYYDTAVNDGGIVLAVPAREGSTESIRQTLLDHGAERINVIEQKATARDERVHARSY